MITYETLKSFCGTEQALRPAQCYAVRIDKWWWATDGRAIIAVPFDKCHPNDTRFLTDELPESAGKYPNVLSIINPDNFAKAGTISVKSLEEALTRLPQIPETKEVEKEIHYIECPCCDDGKIEIHESVHFKKHYYDVEEEVDCPICHGYGKIPDFDDYDPNEDEYDPDTDTTHFVDVPTGNTIPDTENSVLKIGEVYVAAKNIIKLLQVAKDMNTEVIEHGGIDCNKPLFCNMDGVIVYIMNMLAPEEWSKYNFKEYGNTIVEVEL